MCSGLHGTIHMINCLIRKKYSFSIYLSIFGVNTFVFYLRFLVKKRHLRVSFILARLYMYAFRFKRCNKGKTGYIKMRFIWIFQRIKVRFILPDDIIPNTLLCLIHSATIL